MRGNRVVTANHPQAEFLTLTNTYRAFVAGFGSGKTWVGCMRICMYALMYPGMLQGYFAPKHADIVDVFFTTMAEVAETFGLRIVTRRGGKKEVDIYRGKQKLCTVLCISMDNPAGIVGFKIGHALVDELDTMLETKSEHAFNMISARLRWGGRNYNFPNSMDVTTTPEGFKFTYKTFGDLDNRHGKYTNVGNDKFSITRASTYDNEENLREGYIDDLIAIYPSELINAYLNGEFVNLTSGTVYYEYDRLRCRSQEIITKDDKVLRVGMDFNVDHMAAVVYVIRDGKEWHAVDEFHDLFDTPHMIAAIQSKYPDKQIYVYPDASGGNRKSVDASSADLDLLEQAGFYVNAHKANPPVRQRVLAANVALSKGLLYINDYNCPQYADCLGKLAYDEKTGAPDKKSGFDHMTDAGTYPIEYEMPVTKPATKLNITYAR